MKIMTVMIVDDNPAVREMIRRNLGDSVESVYEVGDGSAAVELYPKYRPDWVLMDVAMPHMDGISATIEILRKSPAAKILIVTQYNEPRLAEAAAKAGACGFILKDDLSGLRRMMMKHA